jgi:hypothetical protein
MAPVGLLPRPGYIEGAGYAQLVVESGEPEGIVCSMLKANGRAQALGRHETVEKADTKCYHCFLGLPFNSCRVYEWTIMKGPL